MNKTFTFVAVAALVSSSTIALAQPSTASFADSFAEMQALSSNSSQWQQARPTFNRGAPIPRTQLSVSDYQALASNSTQWQFDQGRIGVDNGPTFAQTHPRGISFADYQALASNSGEYQVPLDSRSTSVASNEARNANMGKTPTLRERWASLFRAKTDAATASD
jgi:hypothetical protein